MAAQRDHIEHVFAQAAFPEAAAADRAGAAVSASRGASVAAQHARLTALALGQPWLSLRQLFLLDSRDGTMTYTRGHIDGRLYG